MAAYKTGAFVHLKYYTPFSKMPLKWIPRSKSGASKSRPRWVAHTPPAGHNISLSPFVCVAIVVIEV